MERLLDRGVGQVGELAQGLTTTPMISKWDVVGATKYPAVDEIDAILLTGSSECSAFSVSPRSKLNLYRTQCLRQR